VVDQVVEARAPPFLDRFESAEVGYLTANGTEWIVLSKPAVKFRLYLPVA